MRRLIIIVGVIISSQAFSTVLFKDDFEGTNGGCTAHYIKGNPPYPGGGFIVFMGGEINSGKLNPGDGTQDYAHYNNVILDSSPAAQNSVQGSRCALKTQYRAGHARNYQLNTTIIKFPEVDTVYIRWYQKWSTQWIWPSDQQKLIKIKGAEQSQNFKIAFGNNYINLTKKSPPPHENTSETYVYSDWSHAETDFRKDDSISGNKNFPLQTGKWYCVEVEVKSNTPGYNDAELRYWIDESLKFEYTNTTNRGTSTRGIDRAELQHVYQLVGGVATTRDMPTWMDNIEISTQRIGCGLDTSTYSAPPIPPLQLQRIHGN